jgi:dTDP-4-amino-4,6-dideoxygalactose transaminase
VKAIRAVLPEHVAIVEDAAHALGARFADGQPVGSSGNLTCFSFYANKNLSTGEGGAIALFDEEMADHLRSLRQNAMPVDAWKRYTHSKSMLYSELTELGYKMNYTDLQACIGRVQLRRQPEFYMRRLGIARRYYEDLQASPVRFQADVLQPNHARHLFMIQVGQTRLGRDDLLLALRARNIGASIHYLGLHQMPLYRGHEQLTLPNTERICECIMTLPISASMDSEDAEYVTAQLKELMHQ